jgi:hypothetical protein
MHRKIAMTILALSLGGCFFLMPPPEAKAQGFGGATAPQGGGGATVAQPRSGATRAVTPRVNRTVTPHATRTITPRTTRTMTQPRTTTRTFGQPKGTTRVITQPKGTSHVVGQPKGGQKTVGPAGFGNKTPRVVTPRGTRTITASRLRGVPTRGLGRTVIGGHNYSAWRSGHRVRHGGGWRTFVGIGALGAIAIGSSEFYPYAYISAPENYCEGLTEDGCELMWQDVETIEGDVVPQCVAYCPWQ